MYKVHAGSGVRTWGTIWETSFQPAPRGICEPLLGIQNDFWWYNEHFNICMYGSVYYLKMEKKTSLGGTTRGVERRIENE